MRTESVTAPLSPIAPATLGTSWRSKAWLIVAAVALLTASAKIQIPLWPVPMTMQTYVVLVIGMGYGLRLGVAAIGSYLVLGALGLPIFAGTPAQGIGVPYMLGPTGGYLVGFLVAAGWCGLLAERGWDRRFMTSVLAMVLGHALIFVCGVAWLAILIGLERAVQVGFMPFVLGTVIKTALAAISLPIAWKYVRPKA
jgi:biotin transport system substrate-specific component